MNDKKNKDLLWLVCAAADTQIDMKALKGSNYGSTFIFTCIDVFSKFGWAESIKNKEAKNCKEALQNIIESSKRKPSYIYLGIFKSI